MSQKEIVPTSDDSIPPLKSWDTLYGQILLHHWNLRPLKHILKLMFFVFFLSSTRPQFVYLRVVGSPKHWEQIIVFKSEQGYRSQILQDKGFIKL